MRARCRLFIGVSLLALFVPMCAGIWSARSTISAMSQTARLRTVFLTFDDGPSANTEEVLAVLREENVPATFFVVGVTSQANIALYGRILEEGHALGLHSFDHDMRGVYKSLHTFLKDFSKLESWILDKTGASLKIFRMVGGSRSMYCSAFVREEILSYMAANGYACFDWDIDAKDSGPSATPAWEIAQTVIQAAKKKPQEDLIVLMHDDGLRTSAASALKTIISYFKARGYAFDTLSEDTESAKKLLPKSLTIDNPG